MLHGHGHLPGLLLELVDIDDLHSARGQQQAAILDEQIAVDAGQIQLLLVLQRQALVGGQEDGAVELPGAFGPCQVMLKLQDVDLHDQGLATAGGNPDRQLIQILFPEGFDPLSFRELGIELLAEPIQVRAQSGPVSEVTVKVVLGKEQGEVLKVQGVQDTSRLVAPLSDAPPVADDVFVVKPQSVIRHRPRAKRLVDQFVVKARGVLLVKADQIGISQQPFEGFQGFDAKLLQYPGPEHQLVGKVGHIGSSMTKFRFLLGDAEAIPLRCKLDRGKLCDTSRSRDRLRNW